MNRPALIAAGLLSCLGSACYKSPRPIEVVRSVSVDGFALVQTVCDLHDRSEEIVLGDCRERRTPLLPDITRARVELAPTEAYERLAPARPAITRCGAQSNIQGTVHVLLLVAPSGAIEFIGPDRGGAELTHCLRATTREVRFRRTEDGAIGSIAIRFPRADRLRDPQYDEQSRDEEPNSTDHNRAVYAR